MMAFRYWCEPPADPNCTDRMTVLPDAAASALRDHRIGGVVLFANNLVSVDQISRLTAQIAAAAPVGMLIGVDEEGGNVFRLPRGIATSFPGNMALGRHTWAPPMRHLPTMRDACSLPNWRRSA